MFRGNNSFELDICEYQTGDVECLSYFYEFLFYNMHSSHSMSGNVSQCGHVLNNPLVLCFTVFVLRFVTAFLSLYHRSHCATWCAQLCVPVHRHGYLTRCSRGWFPKSLEAVFVYLWAAIARSAIPYSESVAPRLRNAMSWVRVWIAHLVSFKQRIDFGISFGQIRASIDGVSKGTSDEAGLPDRISYNKPLYRPNCMPKIHSR